MTDEVKADTVVDAIDPKIFAEMQAENQRLKEFHDKVLGEKKKVEDDAKKQAEKLAREKAETEGDYKQLLEMKDKEYAAMLRERDDKLNSYEMEKREGMLNNTAMKLASELAKTSTKKAETLANILKSRLKLTDDGIKVVDDKGNIISDKLDTLNDYARKEYDFLCDGLQSTGGAGVVVGKANGITGRTIKRTEFDNMPQTQRGEFFKSGGKLID